MHRQAQRPEGGHAWAIRAVSVFLPLVICVLSLAVVLSAPALAADTDAPTIGNTTVLNETAFELVIEDDGGVDEGTIAASDFALDSGSINSTSAVERGNDSVVTVLLTSRIRADNTTVSIEGSIADDAGNELTEGSATVVGIDGYAPFRKEYSVTWLDNTTLGIEVYVDEPIHNASVTISGPQDVAFERADFTETDTPPGNEYRYRTNHTIEQEGVYTVTLASVADAWGNTQLYSNDRRVVQDHTDPIARIQGPKTATVEDPVEFAAGLSKDDRSIGAHEWSVDGTEIGTNATVTHSFQTAGRHEVALTVTDGRGNTDTTRYPIEVREPTTTAAVEITPTNGTGAEVAIGPERDRERVLLERPGGLASNGSVVLDALVVTVPVDERATLGTAAFSGPPAGFDAGVAIGTVEVDHDGPAVSEATVRFTVNRSAIEAAGLGQDDVSLYRDAGGWSQLPTLRVGGNGTHAQYRATAPGLSQFVIAGAETPTDGTGDEADPLEETPSSQEQEAGATDASGQPALAVLDGRLLTRNVSAGETVVVRATVANDGTATGTYTAGLRVNGTVLRTTAVTVPPGERKQVTIAGAVTAGGPVDVNGTRVGAVVVGEAPTGPETEAGGGLPIPNPLSLWPGGLLGQLLGGLIGTLGVAYSVLKGLAIYLGY